MISQEARRLQESPVVGRYDCCGSQGASDPRSDHTEALRASEGLRYRKG